MTAPTQDHQITQATAGKRFLRKGLTGLAVLAACAALAWVLFVPDAVPVELSIVVEGPMQVSIDNQGQVRMHDRYVVAAPVAAELERIRLDEGETVRKAQVIASLKPLPMDVRQRQEAEARLDAARAVARESALHTQRTLAELQLAQNERTRIERLVRDKFISPQAAEKANTAEITSRAEWNAARSREQASQADVRLAQAALVVVNTPGPGAKPRVELVAPIQGIVVKVHEKSERIVAAGAPLVTLGDPKRYEIVVDVLSADAVRIKPGDTMRVDAQAAGNGLKARVRLVEPVAFTKISALGVEEQRVNIIADPIDSLGMLGDGYRIEARIVIWSAERVTKVAASSLFRVADKWHAFVVDKGRAHEREVSVAARNQDEAQIVSGLKSGETVVRFPGNQLSDGVRVMVQR